MRIHIILKPKALITTAKHMIVSKGNSDHLPPNLSTQKIIFK